MGIANAKLRVTCVWMAAMAAAQAQMATEGSLVRRDAQGAACPLKHTAVKAEIAGMSARVNVVQEFQNPYSQVIEAVYMFPLPHDAAVDRLTMTIGDRLIQGRIKTREQAAALYAAAKSAGQGAALLDQERPNIFTQSVANISPGSTVKIAISYIQLLRYEDASYEFRFPMVVGPRYFPSFGVPNASRMAPRNLPQGMRAGHNVSLSLAVDAGMAIADFHSKSHGIAVERISPTRAMVRLRDAETIPNQDFVLRWDLIGAGIQDTVLTHRSALGGYFTLVLQPPPKTRAIDATPKELIFVLDTSGSMAGFPIEKAKEAMRHALDTLNPRDTFNLITFAGGTEILFARPVPATAENLQMAQMFLASQMGSGGTEMMTAIRAALEGSGEPGRVRVVCFMTDGYVGNDMDIIAEVQRHPEARVFSFGIGESVNHYLLDGMARQGRGEVEYVGLLDDGSAAARRFDERVRMPLLTDIRIDWGGLPVMDVYPQRIPDLFGAKPVVVTGRYTGPAKGVVRVRGMNGGQEIMREIRVDLPAQEAGHDSLASLWARQRVEDLMNRDLVGAQRGVMAPGLEAEVTMLGLRFGLVTQFTSMVAVEDRVITSGGQSQRVEVPLEMPQGVSLNEPSYNRASGAAGVVGGVPGGVPGGAMGGVIGGIIGSVPVAAPPPPPPAPKEPPRQFDAGALMAPRVSPREVPVIKEDDERAISPKFDAKLAALVVSGKATDVVDVQILLTAVTDSVLARLERAGLGQMQADRKTKVVTGRIALGNLAALAAAPEVRYVVRRAAAR